MPVVSMKSLLETGVHFGHRTRRWNPKMRKFIFTERNGIHILDLQQTIVLIDDAYNVIRDIVSGGGSVLFVGTKRQAQDTIAREATRAQQPYINQRWLGGTLTNWVTIRQRINHLDRLEGMRENGDFEGLKKRERLTFEREIDKLNMRLGGIRNMRGLPDAVFVVDVNHEETAIKEANKLEIPIIGVVDTNCDPDPVDYVIPSNDDAIRAIKLIVGKMADAALEGFNMRIQDLAEEGADEDEVDYSDFDGYGDEVRDEDLLGEATLAKINKPQEEAEVEAEPEAVVEETAEAVVEETAEVVEAEAPAAEAEAADEPAAEAEAAEEEETEA